MTLAEHLAQPEVSAAEHIARRLAELSAALVGKVPIYLDTRFWIMVREVRDGTSTRQDEREIARLLDGLVHGGQAFCPIGEPTFSDLMSQGNPKQRAATARVIEDLSCRVAIEPDHERMVTEAEALVIGRLVRQAPVAPATAWTSVSLVLGPALPSETLFDPRVELAIQKAFYDKLSEAPLVDIALSMDSDRYTSADEQDDFAARLTAENLAHRASLTSFEKVLQQECHGAAKTIVERSRRLRQMRRTPVFSGLTEEILVDVVRTLLLGPAAASLMPTAHVHAVIHALYRWEYRDKPIVANDLVDFRHAAAALSHCRLLLTEGGLRKTLTHRRMSLASVHDTTVISDRAAVVETLRALAA